MPRYNAKGLEGTLLLADLETSVSSDAAHLVSDSGYGSADTKRIDKALANGRSMPEYPIGADGSEKGVYQSIGDNEDMALFVVEVRETRRSLPRVDPEVEPEVGAKQPSPASPPQLLAAQTPDKQRGPIMLRLNNPDTPTPSRSSMLDSSLSSLGVTPSSGRSAQPTPNPLPPREMPTKIRESSFHQDIPPGKTLPAAFSAPLVERQEPQALILSLNTSLSTFPSRSADMKIEVWLNGDLVQVFFVNQKRSGCVHKLNFAGTRCHRQVEKPWIYQTSAQAGRSAFTAQQRWEIVNKKLAEQVPERGINTYGALPLSADYLRALSKTTFPDRLKEQENLGIFDVVVTTGKGSKSGPSHGYQTQTEPMKSAIFKPSPGLATEYAQLAMSTRIDTGTEPSEPIVSVAPEKSLGHQGPEAEAEPAEGSKPAPTGLQRRTSRRLPWLSSDPPSESVLQTPEKRERVAAARQPSNTSEPPPKLKTRADSRAEAKPSSSHGVEALMAFKIPELCQGCVVSYAGAGVQRQIPKSRPGEFEEEELVAGFRFVVV